MPASGLLKTPQQQARQLLDRGFIMLAAVPLEQIPGLRRDAFELLADLPELSAAARARARAHLREHGSLPEDFDPGLLSGGSLPWSSTYHNPLRRRLEKLAKEAVKPMFAALCKLLRWPREGCVLEVLPDRLLYRTRKAADNVNELENWHRDYAPGPGAEDLIFGGWLNLDTDSQGFMSAPGSHSKDGSVRAAALFRAGTKPGYVTLSAEEADIARQGATIKQVPPGALLVFFESMQHTLFNSTKQNDHKRFPMLRLFTGWRLAQSAEAMQRTLGDAVARGEPLPLKASVRVPVYKGRGQQLVVRNIEWGQSHMHEAFLVKGTGRKGKHAESLRPPPFPPSLADMRAKGVLSQEREAQLREGQEEWQNDVLAATTIADRDSQARPRRVYEFGGGEISTARHSFPRMPSEEGAQAGAAAAHLAGPFEAHSDAEWDDESADGAHAYGAPDGAKPSTPGAFVGDGPDDESSSWGEVVVVPRRRRERRAAVARRGNEVPRTPNVPKGREEAAVPQVLYSDDSEVREEAHTARAGGEGRRRRPSVRQPSSPKRSAAARRAEIAEATEKKETQARGSAGHGRAHGASGAGATARARLRAVSRRTAGDEEQVPGSLGRPAASARKGLAPAEGTTTRPAILYSDTSEEETKNGTG